ncbi:MAG: pantoate--beta-alanine ligase [Deltaproteobacteria bacterium]|nr:pantoate--beta-alanine ligase [Deltaproteobacteria bacterium]
MIRGRPKKQPPRRRREARPRRPRLDALTLQTIDSPALMQAAAMAIRRTPATIGFVPTMGALHDGHLMLMREARRRCDVLVVSIFVNPLQFNDPGDLRRYPRDLDGDRLRCESVGVDLLFVPDSDRMYPDGFDTTIHVDRLTRGLCGAHRTGHFDGMATVVLKLFNLVRPHFAVFGEKDFQQLQVVRRMVRDLALPIEIVRRPVLREVDGLAMSSRNRRLDPEQRAQATALVAALEAAQAAAGRGERLSKKLIAAARAELSARPLVRPEYIEVVDSESLVPMTVVDDSSRILIAAHLGEVRLIDNGPVYPRAAGD